MTDQILVPDYQDIIEKCIKEMTIKYVNYGNDWLEADDLFWKERLTKEIKEYKNSMTIDSEKRKLLNIINIAAMAYETADTKRGCTTHEVAFSVIASTEGKLIHTKCDKCGKPLAIGDGIIMEAKK